MFGQPIQVAHAVLGRARVLGVLNRQRAAAAAIADARSVLEYCPDPGILTESLLTLERPAPVESPRPIRGLRADSARARGSPPPVQRSVGARYRS